MEVECISPPGFLFFMPVYATDSEEIEACSTLSERNVTAVRICEQTTVLIIMED